MKLILKSKRSGIDAKGEYDPKTKSFIVKKGSIVSEAVSHSGKFKGAETIEKYREKYVKDNVVTKDVVFTSASTAANFVKGSSTNGLVAWKSPNNISLKRILHGE
jgi:hypothetical protein